MVAFFTALDEQGKNLLDPKKEGFYSFKNIKIFCERNGKLVELYESNLDMPRNFRIHPPEFDRDYIMALVLNSKKTVIQWNEMEADTIQAEIHDNGASIIVRKVYHNGELKWNGETAKTGRKFTINKQRQENSILFKK
jgi:hypothetical protein